ncbi:MAG: hypothetical protein ACRCWJ_12450 [Casimicrobium sp.]
MENTEHAASGARRRSLSLAFVSLLAAFMFVGVGLLMLMSLPAITMLVKVSDEPGFGSSAFVVLAPVSAAILLGGLFAWIAQFVWRKQSFFVAKVFLSFYLLSVAVFIWYIHEELLAQAIWITLVAALLVWVVLDERRKTKADA